MKKSLICMVTLGLALATTTTYAQSTSQPQNDPADAQAQTVSKKSVNYNRCQTGGKVKVTYGFNKQGLPTYAQAELNGKTRFMPINLYRSNKSETVFGDEDNFSLVSAGGGITSKSYTKPSVMIFSPSSEILFKNCKAGKR